MFWSLDLRSRDPRVSFSSGLSSGPSPPHSSPATEPSCVAGRVQVPERPPKTGGPTPNVPQVWPCVPVFTPLSPIPSLSLWTEVLGRGSLSVQAVRRVGPRCATDLPPSSPALDPSVPIPAPRRAEVHARVFAITGVGCQRGPCRGRHVARGCA